MNVETFAGIKFQGFDGRPGFELPTADDDALERHAGVDLNRALRGDQPFTQPHRGEVRADACDLHSAFECVSPENPATSTSEG